MIKKEDIKVGLEFVLPFREFCDEAEKKEFYNRLISGNKAWRGHKYYTDTCLAGEKNTIVTVYRPILRVLSITENVNITGKFNVVTVKNTTKDNWDNWDAFCWQIDSSFIEEHGQAVKSKKKINGVSYSCIDDFFCDNYPSFKCSQIDNAFCQTPPINNWAQNAIIFGGSRGGNKRNLINNWYHGKIRMPGYENNVEQSNEDSKAFKAITDKMSDTYKRKNHDYGNSFSELFKECGMTYAYGHLAEKLKRIKSLMRNESMVKGESMKDSLYDLANYAILTIMEIGKEEETGK